MFSFLVCMLGLVSASTNDCSLATDRFKIEEVMFVPSHPHAGENTTLYLKFVNPSEPVDDGITKTTLTYNFIPFNPSVESLCKNTICPIPSGLSEQASSSLWPNVAGTVTIRTTWLDLDGNQLLCFEIKEKTFEYDFVEGL